MKNALLITLLAASLSACAGLTPPSTNELAQAPRIEFGQPLPAGDNYILHYPAGVPLPISTVVDGGLFEQSATSTLHVVLKHEIFVFRRHASLDGQTWQRANELIETKLELQIPQKDGSKAGLLHMTLNPKQAN